MRTPGDHLPNLSIFGVKKELEHQVCVDDRRISHLAWLIHSNTAFTAQTPTELSVRYSADRHRHQQGMLGKKRLKKNFGFRFYLKVNNDDNIEI